MRKGRGARAWSLFCGYRTETDQQSGNSNRGVRRSLGMWMWNEDKMVPASDGYQDNIRTVQKQTQRAGEKRSPFQV